jgi:hypothetical protein
MIRTSHMASMFACLVLLSAAAGAQMRRQGGEGGPPPYDRKAEVTITGTAIGTETITPPDRPEQTILLLTVDAGKLGVFVGPTEWVAKQKFAFTKGAEAQVVGNTGFRYAGGAAIQPRIVTIGKLTLEVRDEAGTPMWQGAARGQR